MPANDLISHSLRDQMAGLRRGIRMRLMGEGAASVVTALVALVLVTLLCDWGLHRLTLQPIAAAQRALIALLSLVGVGYVAWRRLIRRSMAPLGDEHLALVMERHYPRLADMLISAVQFSRRNWIADALISTELVQRMGEQVNAIASRLDFLAPINPRAMRRQMFLALAALLVITGIAVASPGTMSLWFQRNVLLRDTPWPRDTYLKMVKGPEFRVVRGGTLSVTVAVEPHSTVTPAYVTFHMKYDTAGTVEEDVEIDAKGIGRKDFTDVTEPFSFWVTGNDGRTEECRVVVVDPPELKSLKLTVSYPTYLRLAPRVFDGLAGAMTIPPGSTVQIEARTTKVLSHSYLFLDGAPIGVIAAKGPPPAMPENPAEEQRNVWKQSMEAWEDAPDAKGYFELPVAKTPDTPATTQPATGRPATVKPKHAGPPTMALTLKLRHTDSSGEGFDGWGGVTIQVDYDKAPGLKVNWLALSKKITAVAMLPLAIDADDRHGLTGLQANIVVKGISREPMLLPIEGVDETGKSPFGADGTIEVADSKTPPKRRVVLKASLIDLKPLGLKVGEVVRVWVEAIDSLPVGMGGPNRRKSDVREFKIVTEKELMGELLKQQKQMRARMQKALSGQADARDRARAAADQASVANTAEVQRLIGESVRKQQTVAGLVASIAYTYQTIYDVMKYNRAGSERERIDMAGEIIEPLNAAVDKTIPALQTHIDKAARSIGSASNEKQLRQVHAEQQRLYEQLDQIMQKMVELENLRELARLLADVLGDSTSIGQGIRDRLKDATSNIFDPDDESTTRPAPKSN